MGEGKPLIEGMEVQLRADWQREVAGYKVLLWRERGGYRLEVWKDLEVVKSWSVHDEASAKAALEELRGLLLEEVEPETAEGAEKLLEELRGRFERSVRAKLVVEGEFGRLEIAASDGAVLRAAMLYKQRGETEWLGELTYAVGTLTPPEDGDGKGGRKARPRTGLFPLLALARAERGAVVERRVVPLLDRVVYLGDEPVPLEFKAQLSEPLDTLLKAETLLEWVKGASARLEEVYPRLLERVKRFANFDWDPRLYHVTACYIAATYFVQVFPAFPQLHFMGSVSSGKTRAGKTVAFASHRGVAATFTSEASVFRLAEDVGATLLIDDVWGPGAKITHLSYKRGMVVLRVEKGTGEKLTLKLYQTYCPLIFTGVELPQSEHLLSRAIIVRMQRAPDPNPKGRDPEPEDFEDLRRELYLAELTQFPEVRRVYEELAGRRRELGLEGRDFEIWGPLLAVAKIAGEHVFEAVRGYALESVGKKLMDLYEEEKEVLAGLERLLLLKVEELFRGELEKLWKGEEENWEAYREKLAGITAKLEEGVVFSAADLLRAMKEVLARKEGEEGGEKPYTVKQFESRWTVQRLGRFLSARLEDAAPFEKKTRSKQLRRITLSSFLKAAERYGFEPDERLLKLAAYMGGKMASEKNLNATYATRTSENQSQQQGGLVSAIDTCVESLSMNGKMASSQGDKGVVSGGVTAGGGETPSPPGEFAILPPSEKRMNEPFLAETIQPSRQKNEINEPGTPGGKSGKLGEPHMPSYHRGSGKLEESRIDEFEEPDEKVLGLLEPARFLREGERESAKESHLPLSSRTAEEVSSKQVGSVSVNDTCVDSLSREGREGEFSGENPPCFKPAERETPPQETPPHFPGQLSLSPFVEKRADKPFLTETVQPREESGKGSEEGSPKGEKGELGGTPTPSLLSENEKLEEVEGVPPPPASAGEPRRNGEAGETEKAENEEACPYWNGEYCKAAGYASFRSEVLEKGRRPPCLGGTDKCPWEAWRQDALRKKRQEEESEESSRVRGG